MDTAEHSLSNKENFPIPEVQKQDIGNLVRVISLSLLLVYQFNT